MSTKKSGTNDTGRTGIDVGDQATSPRRPVMDRGPLGAADVEDTEGHIVFRRDDDSGDSDGRRVRREAPVESAVEDTEGHVVFRTYPGASPDEPDECRSPLPGDEEDRLGRI